MTHCFPNHCPTDVLPRDLAKPRSNLLIRVTRGDFPTCKLCMYECILCVCVHDCVHALCMCVHVCMCKHTLIHTFSHIYMYIKHIHTCTYTYMYAHIYIGQFPTKLPLKIPLRLNHYSFQTVKAILTSYFQHFILHHFCMVKYVLGNCNV